MPPFVTALHFRPGGPQVTGYWETEPPAARTWAAWFHLYGLPATTTVITLIEQLPDGGERLIKRWPPQPGGLPAGSDHRIG
ncbi:hypothetical protein ACFYYM_35805 [Streptomyces erythrochromogenes]|uniref:hypothetical protein n=1 Tax=Streptomyces erythrochromogenes TaxID=285574 RepID=UPI0036878131